MTGNKSRGKYRVRYLPVKYHHMVQGCPNFSATGSVSGMRKLYYGENALLVRCGSYIYNVSRISNVYWNYAY